MKLIEEHEKIPAWLNQIPDSIVLLDTSLNLIFYNKQLEIELQTDLSVQLYQPFIEIFTHLDFTGLQFSLKECLGGKKFSTGYLPFQFKSSRKFAYLQAKFSPFQQDGFQKSIIGILRFSYPDQDKLKNLFQEEKFSPDIFNSLDALIAVIDARGTVVQVNHLWKKYSDTYQGNKEKTGIGSNYFDVCNYAVENGDENVQFIQNNVFQVANGLLSKFEYEYQCQESSGLKWYRMQVTGLNPPNKGAILFYQDISKKIEQEQQMALYKQQLQTLLDNTIQSFFLLDLDYRIVAMNKVASESIKKIWNIEPQNGESILAYSNPGDTSDFLENFQKCVSNKIKITIENQIKYPNGSAIWFEINYIPVLDPSEEVIYVLFTALEITEKKASEEKLKNSEEYYRMIFENNPVAIWIYEDKNLRIIEANHSAQREYGLTREEFKCRNRLNFLIGEDQERYRRHLESRNYTEPFQGRHLKNDRELVYFESFIARVLLDGIPCILEMVYDITRKLEAEYSLKISEERLQNVLGSLDQVVWSIELPNYQLTYISPAVRKIFQMNPEDFYKDPQIWSSVIHPKDKKSVMIENQKLFDQGFLNLRYRIKRRDGTERWLQDSKRISYDEYNRPIRMEGIAIDITEQKLVEQELLNTKKELETLLYRSSHNLKGPVASLKGLFELAPVFQEKGEFNDMIKMVNKRINDLDNTINELVYIAKIKQTSLSFDTISLKQLVQEIIDGKMFLVQYSQTRNHIILSVIDNGKAIQEEIRDRIFEMFYRGSYSSAGSGLGLYIARESVRRLSGELTYSLHNKNSLNKFSIVLPAFWQIKSKKQDK